jgi:glutathione S-transferase
MSQIISILDFYGYWPMVRQVFSERVFEARLSKVADEQQILNGIKDSSRVLNALETIAAEGTQLDGLTVSLADFHLAPMIAYFTAAPEGHAMLMRHPKLTEWWNTISQRKSLRETDPGLPD